MRIKIILAIAALSIASRSAVAEDLTGTLEKIRSTGTIAIGHRESSIPFSYYDDNEKVVGYAMDLCYLAVDAVKAKLGLQKLDVKLVPVTPSGRIQSVLSGAIDLECGTTTNNLERQKVVTFSTTYFVAANRIMAKTASNVRTLDDIRGKTVVSTVGSTNLKQISELNTQRQLGLTILAVKDNGEGFRMLESDRAAAFVMDDILLYSRMANSENPGAYLVSEEALSVEPYGIMLRRDDPAFKKVVDDALAAVYRSGEIQKIYARWFLTPIPPNNVNLNVPMSAPLKLAIEHLIDNGDPAAYRTESLAR
ncbi:amino acid ABC transporter substrate-binding protein [Bradyrhizobium sp. GCM10027634]|uniref:amino acid ABC transporter substrate-binding protein n=1 Tax=unclassified Bradyrhizobium TaxID=2631580 RepID=UPI00188B0D5D|nr:MULTISPECIES: amino acid ABC transporter substrate-binding protein [unclassified Bradyrhizobium]MDN5004541.1 amino acid ABC transporter substrate-binding protein [Bradyrhizobium sp. WYCCWR 12677]QOZ43860.1 amino acid ABC transporter substrate-binding protein [Bradyrhizobium sp. CCBAU 53340]